MDARRLARAEQTMRVRIARDELRRVRELTHTINALKQRSPTWSTRSRHNSSPSAAAGADRSQARR